MNATRLGARKMVPRDPFAPLRTASPLELFFDLVFVVAVSLSSGLLHGAEILSHPGQGIVSFLMVFFAIWWAWMNFTWFASAFDVDDWPYRVITLVQMCGAVLLAIGTRAAMVDSDYRLVIAGYVVMRIAMVVQWVRASRSHPALRGTALRYAVGISVVQAAWIGFAFVPSGAALLVFGVLVACELLIPEWAERRQTTPWHPTHIADRLGSFTLIVLGESVLASTTAVTEALQDTGHLVPLVGIGLAGFVLAAGMWWIYFSCDVAARLSSHRAAIAVGYGHYVVFVAAAALSAGVAVVIDVFTGEVAAEPWPALPWPALALTIPVGVYLVAVWALLLRGSFTGAGRLLFPCGAIAMIAAAFTPWPIVVAAGVMIVLVVLIEMERTRTVRDH